MWTAEWKIIWRKIIAVIYAAYAAAKRKREKNSGLYGIRTLDLCDTGSALYQLSYHANWDQAAYITAMIFLQIISSFQLPVTSFPFRKGVV